MKKPSKILYFGKKVLAFLLSVLVLSLAVFYVSRLAPGDPLVSYYGDRAEKLTPQERAQAEEKLGLDEPIFTQYVRWAQNALRGDFGISYKYKMPAAEVIASRAGNTLLLGGIGFVLGGGWVGIDLDGGEAHGGGAVPEDVLKDFQRLGTYGEISKSGAGYHFIGNGVILIRPQCFNR